MKLRRKSQRGQSAVEMILLLTLFAGIAMFAATQIKDNEWFTKLVQGPWQSLAGMIQNGVWAPPAASMKDHPVTISRHRTPDGDRLE